MFLFLQKTLQQCHEIQLEFEDLYQAMKCLKKICKFCCKRTNLKFLIMVTIKLT